MWSIVWKNLFIHIYYPDGLCWQKTEKHTKTHTLIGSMNNHWKSIPKWMHLWVRVCGKSKTLGVHFVISVECNIHNRTFTVSYDWIRQSLCQSTGFLTILSIGHLHDHKNHSKNPGLTCPLSDFFQHTYACSDVRLKCPFFFQNIQSCLWNMATSML